MRSHGLPDDILVLEYKTLPTDLGALGRLLMLSAIGRLLDTSKGSVHRLDTLAPEPQTRADLEVWLAGKPARRFWRVEDDRVLTVETCGKHILVGTRQLLADLSELRFSWPAPKLDDLDWLWQAAVQYVAASQGETHA